MPVVQPALLNHGESEADDEARDWRADIPLPHPVAVCRWVERDEWIFAMYAYNGLHLWQARDLWERKFREMWRDNWNRVAWEHGAERMYISQWIQMHWYVGPYSIQF